jgi:gliding motility-associated lipoprotein GldH
MVYTKYHTFAGNEWSSKEKAVFDVEIQDTVTLNNISLMIRHADTYPYSNLIVFVTSKYPDGHVTKDTMEIALATRKGEWQGSGAGDIYDFKIPVKKNIRFPRAGKYEFIFEQGMRSDPLPMIMDFGFEIEKTRGD